MNNSTLRYKFVVHLLLSSTVDLFERIKSTHRLKFLSNNLVKEIEKEVFPNELKFYQVAPEFYDSYARGIEKFKTALTEYDTDTLTDFMNYINKYKEL